ncbi:hypothetical protein A2U01_0062000, partial [Trifolium medium]|nr:hypothetical protein [Trifolium medium]
SLKPSISLPPSFLGLVVSVPMEHISVILLFVVPPDLPLGFDGPPVMDAISSRYGGYERSFFWVSSFFVAVCPLVFDHFDPLLGG